MKDLFYAFGLFIIFVWFIPYITGYIQGRIESIFIQLVAVMIWLYLIKNNFFTKSEIMDFRGNYDFVKSHIELLSSYDMTDVLGLYSSVYGKLKNTKDANADDGDLTMEFTKK